MGKGGRSAALSHVGNAFVYCHRNTLNAAISSASLSPMNLCVVCAPASGVRCADVVRHIGAPRPERTGSALRTVRSRLMLHLGVELGAEQNNHD